MKCVEAHASWRPIFMSAWMLLRAKRCEAPWACRAASYSHQVALSDGVFCPDMSCPPPIVAKARDRVLDATNLPRRSKKQFELCFCLRINL